MRLKAVLLTVTTVVLLVPGNAVAEPTWAPADTATIHPGVQTVTDGGQCTANFVFFDASDDIYIGQAAHCASTGSSTDTNGCETGSLPLGTKVTVRGASAPGTLVYSSWLAMQTNKETNANACAFNDFALIKLDPADYGKVNPSVPFWGGPTAPSATSSLGSDVYSYGNSGLRLGLTPLSPKRGFSLGGTGGGWSHQVYTLTPGIPGDSGSAVLSHDGAALGTLSTVAIAPFAGSNGVSDLTRELTYAVAHGGFTGLQMAEGTEAFTPLP